MKTIFDITEFGAIGDGIIGPEEHITGTDNTKAIQTAMDAAAKVEGVVLVPPGRYMTGELKLPHGVTLRGYPGWSYSEIKGSVLVLNDPKAKCLLDITDCHACWIEGIQFYGNRVGNRAQGENIHGVYLQWPNMKSCQFDAVYEELDPYIYDHCGFSSPEDSVMSRSDYIVFDNCQFRNFSGDGLHLLHVHEFTIRNCQMIANLGHGLLLRGFDGWVTNCDLDNNWGYGISDGGDDGFIATVCITGNRFEWNRMGGLRFNASDTVNLANNLVDANFGPGLDLHGTGAHTSTTISGNTFRLNGTPRYANNHTVMNFYDREPVPFDSEYESCHLRMTNGYNISVVGNSFIYGRARDPQAPWRPDYAVVYEGLEDCTIVGNTLHRGALKENLVDLGSCRNVEIGMNPGSSGGPLIDYSEI